MSTRTSKSFCVQPDIQGFLAQRNFEIDGSILENGRRLSANEIRARLTELHQKGFVVVPTCGNHDAKGYCQGHEFAHHELKTWLEPFQAVWDGKKLAEFRKDDRGFAVQDYLELREWAPESQLYSGREVTARITHIARGPFIPEGFAMLSIKVVDKRIKRPEA